MIDILHSLNGSPNTMLFPRPVNNTPHSGLGASRQCDSSATNAQGDVVGIRSTTGAVIARYNYDAFGKLISTTDNSGNTLPSYSFAYQISVRYRGYYYDSETGLYYLQSRYYDPETGRFLNADDVDYLGATGTQLSYNAFAYCENDPVNYEDKTGNAKAWQQLGFKYSNSKVDKKRRAKGVPPQDYAKWLKSGERRLVKGVSVTKLGVTKTMIAITYIPKNRTERYYNHNLGGD